MKTVKFYNRETGQWEPIAGISEVSTGGNGTYDYNELINKPDLSIYALQSELDMIKEQMNGIAAAITNGYDLTVYTVDSGVSTYSLRRSIGDTVLNGAYIPELSNGYYYISLVLNNEKETIDLNTDLSEVNKIKIHYPKETTYIKFANTQVKEVIQIQGENINDATGMFTNCTSLEKADLTGLPNTVQVDSTMFAGANYDADVTFSEDWEHSNRDIGLVRTVEVIMHHYREDGLYENSSIFIKSQYDENPVQYVIRQVDPEDERWRYEPFTLEYDTAYEIYFEDNGNTGETMNACFMDNMNIFFVGGSPTSFTNSRPEIEEPEYITGFKIRDWMEGDYVELSNRYSSVFKLLDPNETDRPVNFIAESDFEMSYVAGYDDLDKNHHIRISVIPGTQFDNNYHDIIIRETYSNTTQVMRVLLTQTSQLIAHYKPTDGESYFVDSLELTSITNGNVYRVTFEKGMCEAEANGYYRTETYYQSDVYYIEFYKNENPTGRFDQEIHLTSNKEIWFNDTELTYYESCPDSSEPEQPEEPDTPEEPENNYITWFNANPTSLEIQQNGSGQVDIETSDVGKEVNFIAYFEDMTYSDPETLYANFIMDNYNNGYNIIHCIINYQIPDQLGTATLVIRESNSGCEQRIPVTIIEAGSIDTVERVFHINDIRNAFEQLNLTLSYDPYTVTEYDLANAETDEYGKVLTLQVNSSQSNDFQLVDTDYEYDGSGFGFDPSQFGDEVWFNIVDCSFYDNQPDVGYTKDERVTLTVHYKPHDNDASSKYLNISELSVYRKNLYFPEDGTITYEAVKGANIGFDLLGTWYDLGTVNDDREIWLLSHDSTIYDSEPDLPSYERYDLTVHFQKPDCDYTSGEWYVQFGEGNWSSQYDLDETDTDDFGLIFNTTALYTNVPYTFHFFDSMSEWDSYSHTIKFDSPVTDVWFIWGDYETHTEKPGSDNEGEGTGTEGEEPTDTPEGNDTPTEEPDTPEGGGTEEPTPEEPGDEIIEEEIIE